MGFKGINQRFSEFKTGFQHVSFCFMCTNVVLTLSVRAIFSLNIKLWLNKSDRLETIEKHFHLKDCDPMNNSGRY